MSTVSPAAIVEAARSGAAETVLQPFSFDTEAQNQLLFFFKPEVFTVGEAAGSRGIVELALSCLDTFGVEVAGAAVIGGPRLAELAAMDRHYGFINRISRAASTVLSDAEKADIRAAVGAGAEVPVMGGHEYLAEAPGLSPAALDALWAEKKSVRIRSGLYTQRYTIGGREVVLLNGFHPQQLAHFTDEGRAIGLLLLNSDQPWSLLRGTMLGDTFPEKAAPGSLRRVLFEEAGRYGLGSVGIANNCAHLSAGPFEALFELNNFLSGLGAVDFDLGAVKLSKQLAAAGVDAGGIEAALSNPEGSINGNTSSLFDATEDLDSLSSAALYARFFNP